MAIQVTSNNTSGYMAAKSVKGTLEVILNIMLLEINHSKLCAYIRKPRTAVLAIILFNAIISK